METEEAAFIRQVDEGFPYDNPQAATELIKRGCAISANAAFTIAYELAVQPRGAAQAEPATLLLLLDIWDKIFEHPLKAMILRFAQAMVRGESLTTEVVLDAMDIVANHPGEYQALNVVYFSRRDNARVDAAYDDVHESWQ